MLTTGRNHGAGLHRRAARRPAVLRLGRRYHRGIRSLRGLRDHPEWLLRAEHYFQRYGVASLLVGRFIGPLRPMLPMTAGMLDMPFGRFLLVSLCAAAGWSMAYLLPGWSAGAAMRLPLEEGFWSEAAVVVGALLTLIATTAFGSLRQLRWVTALATGLSIAILLGLFLGWRTSGARRRAACGDRGERSITLDRVMVLITRVGDFQTSSGPAYCCACCSRSCASGVPRSFHPYPAGYGHGQRRTQGLLRPCQAGGADGAAEQLQLSQRAQFGRVRLFLTTGVLAGRDQPPRLRLAWLVLASLPATAIALSRVYGVHWMTDVTAGALLAASICALSLTQCNGAHRWRRCRQGVVADPAGLPGLLGAFSVWALPTAMQMYRYQ